MSKVLRFFLKTALKYFARIKNGNKYRKVMVYENKYDYQNRTWNMIEIGIGDFLSFGIDSDSGSNASFSIAIVEMPDGTVRTAELNLIRFVKD